MMRELRRVWSWLLYGGSRKLRDYDRGVLDYVSEQLTPRDRQALAAQLRNLDHLKRLHVDRMVTFYYVSPKTLPKLSNTAPDNDLAWLVLKADRKQVCVRVRSHRGLFFSLEFVQSPKDLKGKPVEISPSRRRPKDRDLGPEIDALEHGQDQ